MESSSGLAVNAKIKYGCRKNNGMSDAVRMGPHLCCSLNGQVLRELAPDDRLDEFRLQYEKVLLAVRRSHGEVPTIRETRLKRLDEAPRHHHLISRLSCRRQ